ncbi:hypothetical protein CDD81_8120 [Ophiocordyceps australis]|uniref:Uncharacterized protein n=1 Tax=Ophiocordyceps australis TaxID=1399860 RepID=A0A2C5XWG6_9HYPO|nr:hypothetical protein CDD81_8120 [Ophiocordyceps australis]
MALGVEPSLQQPQSLLPRWRPKLLPSDMLHTAKSQTSLHGLLRFPLPDVDMDSTLPAINYTPRPRVSSPAPPSRALRLLAPATAPLPPPPASRARSSQFLPISSLLNPHTGLKRRRSKLDVDGPNTATLSSKKRRLRMNLVTSRLSQPFSAPATHIHSRRDMQSPANPSIQTEEALGAQRRIANLVDTSFLKMSIMNRMQKRLGAKGQHAAWQLFKLRCCATKPQFPDTDSKRLGRQKSCLYHSKSQPRPVKWLALTSASSQLAALEVDDSGPSDTPMPPLPLSLPDIDDNDTDIDMMTVLPTLHQDTDGVERPDKLYCHLGPLFDKSDQSAEALPDGLDRLDDLPWIAT